MVAKNKAHKHKYPTPDGTREQRSDCEFKGSSAEGCRGRGTCCSKVCVIRVRAKVEAEVRVR